MVARPPGNTLFETVVSGHKSIMSLVLDRLAAETNEKRFEVLKKVSLGGKGNDRPIEEASLPIGKMSVAAITSAFIECGRRFRALLFEEVADYSG